MNPKVDPKNYLILAVDDEERYHQVYRRPLEKLGYSVDSASNGIEALNLMENNVYDLVIADQSMPEMDGLRLLEAVRRKYPDTGYIIVTGKGTIKSAVIAIKSGADNYLSKPVDKEELLLNVEAALQKRSMVREIKYLREHLLDQFGMDKLVGRSQSMIKLFQTARKIANSEATILLQGESGTGKELLAKAIHFNSPRRNNPMVTIDCGSMPLELLQSELFGHIKGAFTGATRTRRGLFEEARGGTIFLDEIGEIPEPLQLGLLRVLQEREIRPIGSDKSVPIDVRVISASNKTLKEEVEKGQFRRDLYYRLAVITLEIPPLRERQEDIPTLVKFFLDKYNQRNNKKVLYVSPDAMSLLYSYYWEGNVRELENVIERAVVLSDGASLTPDILPEEFHSGEAKNITNQFFNDYTLKEISSKASASMERNAIINALKSCNGNKKKSAEILGISRASLYNKLKSYKIDFEKQE